MKLFLTSIIATIAAVSAAPAEGHVAPRAYQSGTTTCYYQCPSTVRTDYTYEYDPIRSDRAGRCGYSYFWIEGPTCTYDPSTGILTPGQNAAVCPGGLSATCGPTPPRAFKRSMVKRELTEGEKAIIARQYRYPKQG